MVNKQDATALAACPFCGKPASQSIANTGSCWVCCSSGTFASRWLRDPDRERKIPMAEYSPIETWTPREHQIYEVGYQEGGSSKTVDWLLTLEQFGIEAEDMDEARAKLAGLIHTPAGPQAEAVEKELSFANERIIGKDIEIARLVGVASRYMLAVKRLGEESGYNRLTYFAAPILKMPTEETKAEACDRWIELTNAGVELTEAISAHSQPQQADGCGTVIDALTHAESFLANFTSVRPCVHIDPRDILNKVRAPSSKSPATDNATSTWQEDH